MKKVFKHRCLKITKENDSITEISAFAEAASDIKSYFIDGCGGFFVMNDNQWEDRGFMLVIARHCYNPKRGVATPIIVRLMIKTKRRIYFFPTSRAEIQILPTSTRI